MTMSLGTHRKFTCGRYVDIACALGHVKRIGLPARPPDPNLHWFRQQSENLNCAVLRPVSRSSMNLSSRTRTPTGAEADRCTDTSGISRRTCEAHAQPGFCADVVVQLCRRTILSYHQVQSTIAIIIRGSGPTLLTVNHNATLLPCRGTQTAFAVSS